MMTREAKQHMNGGMGPYELKRTFTDTLKVYESDPFSNRAPSQNRSTVKCLKLKILKTFSRKIANSTLSLLRIINAHASLQNKSKISSLFILIEYQQLRHLKHQRTWLK
jgi:hypothetical protein